MKYLFNIPSEVLKHYILEHIPSYKLKIMLKDPDVFAHVKEHCPCIVKDCFTPVKPLFDEDYDNVHDMKQYLGSKDMNLTNKVITILNYEWCFVNPLKLIIRMVKERDLKVCNQLVSDILRYKYSYIKGSPKTLTPLIKIFIDEMKFDPSVDDNEAIFEASERGYISIVKMMVKDPRVNPSINLIQWASVLGYHQIVKVLLEHPKVDPSTDNNLAIRGASKGGHLEIVKLLLSDPRVKPFADNNNAIRMAVFNNHPSVVALLLKDPCVDPSVCNNICIIWACKKGYTSVVRLLLNDIRVNPSARGNYPLQLASKCGHDDIVELLLNDPRVETN